MTLHEVFINSKTRIPRKYRNFNIQLYIRAINGVYYILCKLDRQQVILSYNELTSKLTLLPIPGNVDPPVFMLRRVLRTTKYAMRAIDDQVNFLGIHNRLVYSRPVTSYIGNKWCEFIIGFSTGAHYFVNRGVTEFDKLAEYSIVKLRAHPFKFREVYKFNPKKKTLESILLTLIQKNEPI